jgi:hypothetical protein
VKHRLPPWLVLLCLAAICVALIMGVAALRSRRTSPASLLSRLPADDSIILYIDFHALRDARVLGLLGSSRVAQEPEYRAFVEQTGFDYLNDLDSAFVSFHSSGTYFLLRGRFDWKNLRDYTVQQGGSCYNTLCKVNGSTPDRRISFFPLQSDIMALAVSRDDSAATEMQARKAVRNIEIPHDPVWSLIPVAVLKNNTAAPPGTRAFARALEGADALLVSAAPEGTRISLRLDASCRTDADARSLAEQLREATARLREMLVRENQTPNPRDLSGVLAAGAFEQKELHVFGRWPIERSLLESLAGSAL